MSQSVSRFGTPLQYSIGCYSRADSRSPLPSVDTEGRAPRGRSQRMLAPGADVDSLDRNAPTGSYVNLWT